MIKTGDRFKNIENGKVFKVKSADLGLIILATTDESHSMLVNPARMESMFLPFEESEANTNVKNK